jgi:hypothetical protein
MGLTLSKGIFWEGAVCEPEAVIPPLQCLTPFTCCNRFDYLEDFLIFKQDGFF